jgi:hypothetical protein
MLTKTAAALVSGGEQARVRVAALPLHPNPSPPPQDVFTPMYLIVMQKPLSAK